MHYKLCLYKPKDLGLSEHTVPANSLVKHHFPYLNAMFVQTHTHTDNIMIFAPYIIGHDYLKVGFTPTDKYPITSPSHLTI